MIVNSKATISAILLVTAAGLLSAQPPAAGRGGRGAAGTYWVEKTKGGVYVPPNKPLTRLSDLKAKHAGQATWTELVVKDPDTQAEYNSAAPGTKISRRFHPDTGDLIVVVDGQMRFEIEGQEPFIATRGSLVNILKTTFFSWEVTGDKPALWVDVNPLNFQTLYPGNDAAPRAMSPGADVVKVSFPRTLPTYTAPNMPHWNLFEAAKAGPPGGTRVSDDPSLRESDLWFRRPE